MIKNLVCLLFISTLCLFAKDKKQTIFDKDIGILIFEVAEEVGSDWALSADGQSNPNDCPSNRFQFNGANFICLRIDRLKLIRAQRDFHYATQEWYRLHVVAKDAYSVLDELQRNAREVCKKQGKIFSEQTADCEGSLTPGGNDD